MTTAFSHSVRLLMCDGCGAPLETAVSGGVIECSYCGARSEIVRRDEDHDRAAAAQAEATAPSESERIAQLRRQADEPLLPPPSLQHYLAPGATTLRPERLEEAKKDWLVARQQLAQGGVAAAERLFHLTLLIAPLLEDRLERALLETALESLPDARHRQLLRRRLVHRAVLIGDADAAEAWLAPCHPRATELHMDTAYRIAASYAAIAQGNAQQVLNLLGQHPDDLPIAEGNDAEAGLLRAHGLELSGLGRQAEEALVHTCRKPTRFGAVAKLIETNATLKLCAASWQAAEQRLWLGVRTGLTSGPSPYYALTVAFGVISSLLLVAVAVLNAALGFELAATIVLTILAIVFGAIGIKEFGKHRRYLELNRVGELAFARLVSISQQHRQVKEPGSQVSKTVVDQVLDLVIETPEGPTEGNHTITMDEEPALGRYPCLYHPQYPDSRIRVRIGDVDA